MQKLTSFRCGLFLLAGFISWTSCGVTENHTNSITTTGNIGGGGTGGGGGAPINQQQICQDMCETDKQNCLILPTCMEWCIEQFWNSPPECIDEAAAYIECLQSNFEKNIACNSLVCPVRTVYQDCLYIYGGCIPALCGGVYVNTEGNKETKCYKWCDGVRYSMTCALTVDMPPITCKCYEEDQLLGTCVPPNATTLDEAANMDLEKTCCNEFFGL